MGDLKVFPGGKPPVPKDEEQRPCAISGVQELLEQAKEDGIPYNKAVVILLSDDVDDASLAGFKTATVNAPSYEGLGMLQLGTAALLGRIVG